MIVSILGAGWLGMPFGKKLVKAGYQVKGSTTRSEKLPLIRQAGLQAYLLEVDQEIRGQDPDAFFHCDVLLINIPPGRRNPQASREYPQRIQLILQKAREQAVGKCLFISSTGVYPAVNRIVTEQDAVSPDNPLVVAEKLVQDTFGTAATILRMAGLAGPGRQMGRFLAGRKGVKNGKAPVNLVHLDDALALMLAIIEQDKWGELFNVCTDVHPLREVLYPAQALRLGLEPPEFARAEELAYKIVSNERIKRALNYTFQHPDPIDF